jgi:cell division protein FtsZ
VFTFPARQPTPAPAAEATDEPIAEDETPEIDLAANEEDGDDELLLGADDILTSPVGAPPIAPPEDDAEAEEPTTSGGGTLFERMSNIARGAPKAQIDEDESGYRSDPIDIPRFLNRQNNQ